MITGVYFWRQVGSRFSRYGVSAMVAMKDAGILLPLGNGSHQQRFFR
jgi:hypothetical protein